MAITEKSPIVLTIKDLCASKAEFFQRAREEAVRLMNSAEFRTWQLKRPSGPRADSLACVDIEIPSAGADFCRIEGMVIAINQDEILTISRKNDEIAQKLRESLIAHELKEGWVLVKPGFNLQNRRVLAHNLGLQAEYDLAARLGILGISLEIDQGYINACHRKGIFSEMKALEELHLRQIAAEKALRRAKLSP